MSKRIFTKEQIEELLKNECIATCSEKSITFSQAFKASAVKRYNEQGLSASEIFRIARLNLALIGRTMPKDCLKRWNKVVRSKGEAGLTESRGSSGKGGRPKSKHLTDNEKIEHLEAQVAYLKAENDFLAKLRAKRAE